jgi:hypothetical protein
MRVVGKSEQDENGASSGAKNEENREGTRSGLVREVSGKVRLSGRRDGVLFRTFGQEGAKSSLITCSRPVSFGDSRGILSTVFCLRLWYSSLSIA